MKRWLPYFLSALTLGGVAVRGQEAPPVTTILEKPVAATATANRIVAPNDLSFSTSEVIRLQQNGVTQEVILSYIRTSGSRFQLSAEDIIFCHKLGLSSAVISGMIQRDQQLPAPQQPVYATPPSAPAPAPAPAPVQTVVQQQPAQTIVVQQPPPQVVYTTQYYTTPYVEPVYVSPYPYYGYPYRGYYGPAVSVGVGFGFGGHYHHGGRGGIGVGIGF